MNASTSEYSSGCESGWTTYLDQISDYSDPYTNNYQQKAGIHHINNYVDHHHHHHHQQQDQYQDQEEEEEEDLSMVSDASSAPPNSTYYYSQHKIKNNNNKNNKKKSSYNNKSIEDHNLCLDDTATSSILHFSQGESVTKSKRLSFFKSSTKGKSGNVVGRKRQ